MRVGYKYTLVSNLRSMAESSYGNKKKLANKIKRNRFSRTCFHWPFVYTRVAPSLSLSPIPPYCSFSSPLYTSHPFLSYNQSLRLSLTPATDICVPKVVSALNLFRSTCNTNTTSIFPNSKRGSVYLLYESYIRIPSCPRPQSGHTNIMP